MKSLKIPSAILLGLGLFIVLPSSVRALTVIDDCQDLQNMKLNLSEDYELNESGGDIDCTGFDDGDGNGFRPVGAASPFFTGNFDGKNKKIINLSMDRSGEFFVGLFGITVGAIIKDVTLETVNIRGGSVVGALVASARTPSTIDNVSVTGRVENTGPGSNSAVGGVIGFAAFNGPVNITNTHFDGDVIGVDNVAGLVGLLATDSTVSECSTKGTVTGSACGFSNSFRLDGCGGLIGWLLFDNVIERSYSESTVTVTVAGSWVNSGGLIGNLGGRNTVRDSYAKGDVIGGGSMMGGLIGNFAPFGFANITNSYSTGNVTNSIGSSICIGGFIGCSFARGNTGSNVFSTGGVFSPGTSGTAAFAGQGRGFTSNIFWFDDPTDSVSAGCSFGSVCETGKQTDITYFQGAVHSVKANAPMVNWDFVTTPIWREVTGPDDFPILEWQVPAVADADGDGVDDADDLCPGTAPAEPVDVFGCSANQCPSGAATCADYAIIGYDEDELIINTSGDVVGNVATVDSITEGTGDSQTTTLTIPPQDDGFGPTVRFLEDTGSTSGTGFVGAFTAVGLTNAVIIGPAGTSFSPAATICITFADTGFCCDGDSDGFDDSFVIGKDGDDPGTLVGDNIPPDEVLDTTCVDNFDIGGGFNPCGQAVDPSLAAFAEVQLCAEVSTLSTFYAGQKNANITGNNEVDEACHVIPGALVYANAETGKSNHGAYVACVANAVFDLRKSGAINKSEGGAIIRTAAKSGVNR